MANDKYTLMTIDAEILLRHSLVLYWHAVAITGVAKERALFHSDGTEYSDAEKIEDALNIAGRNVELLKISVDKKKELVFNHLEEQRRKEK